MLIVGTTYAERRFFPFGLAVVSKERHFDFKFIFSALQKGRIKIGEPELSYDLPLMEDAAEAITNGYKEAGFIGIRGMCWFQVVKNCKKHLLLVKDKKHAAELMFDINKLQTCRCTKEFEAVAVFFVEKWMTKVSEEVDTFILYFEEQWIVKEPNWFEGDF